MTDKLDDAVRPVAWMNPHTGGVASDAYLEGWMRDFGEAGQRIASRYTEPLCRYSAIAHLQARVEALTGEVVHARALAEKSLEYIEHLEDSGPMGYGWQSDELESLVRDIRSLTQPEADHE